MNRLRLLRRSIRFFFQRRFRGFDDSELWSLDFSIVRLVLPRLKAFRAIPPAGYPEDAGSYENWLEILDRMIAAFEYLDKEQNWPLNHPKFPEEQAAYKVVEEGHRLFYEYFGALWD